MMPHVWLDFEEKALVNAAALYGNWLDVYDSFCGRISEDDLKAKWIELYKKADVKKIFGSRLLFPWFQQKLLLLAGEKASVRGISVLDWDWIDFLKEFNSNAERKESELKEQWMQLEKFLNFELPDSPSPSLDSTIQGGGPQDFIIRDDEPQDFTIQDDEPQDFTIQDDEPQDSTNQGGEPHDETHDFVVQSGNDNSSTQGGEPQVSTIQATEPPIQAGEPHNSASQGASQSEYSASLLVSSPFRRSTRLADKPRVDYKKAGKSRLKFTKKKKAEKESRAEGTTSIPVEGDNWSDFVKKTYKNAFKLNGFRGIADLPFCPNSKIPTEEINKIIVSAGNERIWTPFEKKNLFQVTEKHVGDIKSWDTIASDFNKKCGRVADSAKELTAVYKNLVDTVESLGFDLGSVVSQI